MQQFLAQKREETLSRSNDQLIGMQNVSTIILGGGQGTRLFPLTKSRCKPAVPFAGQYRLIDIPICNAVNSGCREIYILTQYLGRSLQQHIYYTYRNTLPSSISLEVISAEEKEHKKVWFEGTADAVRQSLESFLESDAEYFLILSGDQVYNMDYREMVQFSIQTDADVVIAALPISEIDAKRMGVLKIDEKNFITSFLEKPQTPMDLDKMRISGLDSFDNDNKEKFEFLGSMGIYLFKRKALIDLLKNDPRTDFGKHLIPTKVNEGIAAAFIHKGYFEDVGSIANFYQANMDLISSNPAFSYYNDEWPFFGISNALPAAVIKSHTRISSSILSEGSLIEADEVSNSILGPRIILRKGCKISDSYLMGNDSYKAKVKKSNNFKEYQISENSVIKKSIIDKNVIIGKNVQLINHKNLLNYDNDLLYIRDGIIIVPSGVTIPDGYKI